MAASSDETNSALARLVEAHADTIVDRYVSRLRGIGSKLANDDETLGQIADQARLIVKDVVASLSAGDLASADAMDLSWRVGASRAAAGVHPAESLRAAVELFDTVIAHVNDLARDLPAPAPAVCTAALALQRGIMARIRWASGAYLSFILEEVHQALLAERRRIARELHDRVGGQASIVIRDLELLRAYRTSDSRRAEAHLAQAYDVAVGTMDAVRRVSGELRLESEFDNLEKALLAFIEAMAEPGRTVELSVNGDEAWIPANVLDEVFYLAREALRNAIEHSDAAMISCTLDLAPHELRGVISDDGIGFDTASKAGSGEGISSMRERAAAVGGQLVVTSERARGTRVEFAIPISRAAAR
ncbi:MAG: sensor histidine kinase [Frankiaceae bacterium]